MVSALYKGYGEPTFIYHHQSSRAGRNSL